MSTHKKFAIIGSQLSGRITTLQALRLAWRIKHPLVSTFLLNCPSSNGYPPGLKILALDLRPEGIPAVLSAPCGAAPYQYQLWLASQADAVGFVWRGTIEDDSPYALWEPLDGRKSSSTRSLFKQIVAADQTGLRPIWHQLNGIDELPPAEVGRLSDSLKELTGKQPFLTNAKKGALGGLDVHLRKLIEA